MSLHKFTYVDMPAKDSGLQQIWNSKLSRSPGCGRYIVAPQNIDCLTACKLLREDPKIPGVLGIDCEFYMSSGTRDGKSDRVERMTPWKSWPEIYRRYPIDKFGNPNIHGPFVRLIQIARADGTTVLFDLFEMAELPSCFLKFLHDKTIQFLGHDFTNDMRALENTDRRFGEISISADSFKTSEIRSL
jgi:hypothetical protein